MHSDNKRTVLASFFLLGLLLFVGSLAILSSVCVECPQPFQSRQVQVPRPPEYLQPAVTTITCAQPEDHRAAPSLSSLVPERVTIRIPLKVREIEKARLKIKSLLSK